MNELARLLRGASFASYLARSWLRLTWLRLKFPGLQIVGTVRVGANCDFYVGQGSRAVLENCVIGSGVRIATSPGAKLRVAASVVGPNSVIVARESIHVGRGTKIAEMVVIRDGNHDHTEPLDRMKFVSSPVSIGEDVWLAARSTILAGVAIGDHSTVGAGSVVTKSVPAGATVVGVPARVLRIPDGPRVKE